MTNDDFVLSERIVISGNPRKHELPVKVIIVDDVMGFIRRLKASPDFDDEDKLFIDTLAGKELIK